MEYVIITFLVAIFLELTWIIIYIHRINGYLIFNNDNGNNKSNEDVVEDDENKNIKGIDKINRFKIEDFDANI